MDRGTFDEGSKKIMSKPSIEVKNLSVIYDKKHPEKKAVDDFSISIHDGEFFGLLGPNGAGKTSVISSLTGLLEVKYGEVLIFGKPAGSTEAKYMIGVVPQELVHHGFFTVNQILNFFSGYYGIQNNQKRIDYLLEHLQLATERNKRVSQLSGGMKRRLLIAKALVHSPRILLLDEPSAGVDIELRAILWDFMTELNCSGTTIVLTTHYLEEAQRLCKRVAIMNYGKLLSLDNTGKLIEEMVERNIIFTLKNGAHLDPHVLQRPPMGMSSIQNEGEIVRLSVSGKQSLDEVLQALHLELKDIRDIKMLEGSLEHAFMKIVGRNRNASKSAVG